MKASQPILQALRIADGAGFQQCQKFGAAMDFCKDTYK
jgi:hypothetical protein